MKLKDILNVLAAAKISPILDYECASGLMFPGMGATHSIGAKVSLNYQEEFYENWERLRKLEKKLFVKATAQNNNNAWNNWQLASKSLSLHESKFNLT